MNKKFEVEMELWRWIGVIVFTFVGIYSCLEWLKGLIS